MTGITARALYQQRRPAPERSNNSLRRTYDLLRSSLHPSLEPGASLVEEELVRTLSSSRNTVRAALQLLAQEGLVSRGPKVGTMAQGSILLPFNDLLDVSDKVAYRMNTEVLEMSVMPAPSILLKWLHLPTGASVLLLEMLVLQDGEKVGLSVSYVGLTSDQQEELVGQPPDAIRFLEDILHVRIGEAETTVSTLAADAQTAALLDIAEGTPMLWLEDFLRDEEGAPLAVTQLRYRGDRVAFSAKARRPSLAS